MNNVILLVACFALGIALRMSGRLPNNAPSTLNAFIVNVSLPALTLVTVHELAPDARLVLAALMPWGLFGMGVGFFWLAGRLLKLSRATTGALMLTGSMANTSFIGLPMIEMWYGIEYLGIGIVADQLGSYFVLSTVGVLVAGMYSSGATLVPLALVSVGYQLRLSQIRGRVPALGLGLAFKLVLGPALVFLILIGLLDQRGAIIQISVFEAAMGPMIGAAIVAMDHDLDPALVTLMVGIGIPLCFLTLPAWWWLLRGFG